MIDIIDFLTETWEWMARMVLEVSPFTFSFADILRTEILVFVGIELIGLIYHFGSSYNWRSDGNGGS